MLVELVGRETCRLSHKEDQEIEKKERDRKNECREYCGESKKTNVRSERLEKCKKRGEEKKGCDEKKGTYYPVRSFCNHHLC